MATTLEPHRTRRRPTRRTGTASSRPWRTSTTTSSTRSRAGCPRGLTGHALPQRPGQERGRRQALRAPVRRRRAALAVRVRRQAGPLPQSLRAHHALPRRARRRQAGRCATTASSARAARSATRSGCRRTSPTRASSTTRATCSRCTRAGARGSSIPTRSRRSASTTTTASSSSSYTYSAHPTWDPATGELYNFGIQYGPRTKLRTYRVDTQRQAAPPARDQPALRDAQPRLRADVAATWCS